MENVSEESKPTLPRVEIAVDDIMRYFEYEHLSPPLAKVSAPFCLLAKSITDPNTGLPRCPERTVALRKLLEAKDCAVRASLPPK